MDPTERKYTVYMHTMPNGKKYIGITCRDVVKRWRNDGIGYKKKKCSYLWNAIVKYGWNKIQHEVLAEDLTEKEAKQLEKDFILTYKTQDPLYGYNLTAGGDGMCGWIPSVETRALISAGNTGKTRTAEMRAKNSAAQMGNQHNLGNKASSSARAAMSAAGKGRPKTAQHRANISAARMGIKASPATRVNLRTARRLSAKDVECLTIDGEVVRHYNSLAEAAEKTGIDKTSIWRVCSGKNKTAGKFRWRYA